MKPELPPEEEQLRLKIAELKDRLRAMGYEYHFSLYGTVRRRDKPEEHREKRIEIFSKLPPTPELVLMIRDVFRVAVPPEDYVVFTVDESKRLRKVVIP